MMTALLQSLRHRAGPFLREIPKRVELRATAARGLTARPQRWLDAGELPALQAQYPFRTGYKYDAASVRRRAEARVTELLHSHGAARARRVLEVGCADGLVSALLHGGGRRALGIDLPGSHIDPRAHESGATFAHMDAQALGLADASLDYVCSYNAFEHLPDPAAVLRELTRVLRQGGHLFLQFGPLYCSPWGAHAYRTITVPYCQFLFPRDVMNEYAAAHGLGTLRPGHVNGWTLEQYEATWRALSPALEIVRYEERRDYSHLGIIRRYPGCFRKRAPSARNFVVTHLSVLFRRR